ncbi:hypothetical protein ruthe_01435 [Rubellimicrobium thermophilum DSM 16684]|uniref:Uncharacterized protein n=1 Tax=Rubellimicrobium thermophilum DSM 16684 TaxID=1123069 RepID=S9R3S3_9RHOB|nr:DUF6497 family protein [Rubellimicrobium thermophilum]EPX86618.1 hypothetical protein ruthe_01435 [Rubellimicrobium thermophilum DSM 16684]
MTTFRFDRLVAAALLAGIGVVAAAEELLLPSGHAARLFDVVLEAGSPGILAPDAFTDPEAGPEAAEELLGDEPLDQGAGTATTAGPGGAGGLARFRLMVEGLGGEGAGWEDVAGDFAWLCERLALPALAAHGWTPTEVVIALSDREIPFGRMDPEAVQFIEGFRIAEGACVPQAF